MHARVNIRKSHPNLYRLIMILCVARIALAFNFWGRDTTFHPFGVSNNMVGVVFMVLGVGQMMFLNLLRDLRLVRMTMAASVAVMTFWGLANTQQSFAGTASFQLPIMYLALAAVQVPLLLEAHVNPMTEKR